MQPCWDNEIGKVRAKYVTYAQGNDNANRIVT